MSRVSVGRRYLIGESTTGRHRPPPRNEKKSPEPVHSPIYLRLVKLFPSFPPLTPIDLPPPKTSACHVWNLRVPPVRAQLPCYPTSSHYPTIVFLPRKTRPRWWVESMLTQISKVTPMCKNSSPRPCAWPRRKFLCFPEQLLLNCREFVG